MPHQTMNAETPPSACLPSCQVLSRDIRTVHQRVNIGPSLQAHGVGHYHVVLDGIVVQYDIDSSGTVLVTSASVDLGQP